MAGEAALSKAIGNCVVMDIESCLWLAVVDLLVWFSLLLFWVT
jgi:hypothetical protein